MYIDDFMWLPDIIDKLIVKHHVTPDEVEETFFNGAYYRFVEKGHQHGEDVYAAMGQTDAGRYLIVFFIHKSDTIEGIAEFWETHSLDDHWDETYEVAFKVRAKQRRRVTLDPEVYAQIENEARQRGMMPETLVNVWLVERLQKTA